MNSLILGYFAVSIVLIVVFIITEIIQTEIVSLLAKEIVTVGLIFVLGIAMLYIPTHLQKTETIGDAVLIERFNDADLYYDADLDLYFAVETSQWNPFKLYNRVEIPQEFALDKIMNDETSTKTDP